MKPRKRNKLVFGIGTNDYAGVVKDANGKHIPSYRKWKDMLKRCYSEKYLQEYPTYRGCSVCPEWLYFSNFKDWYDENVIEGFQVDKDLLIESNKVYSPETCLFVSRRLNTLFTDSRNSRGLYPQGVGWMEECNKFRTHLKRYGKQKHLGVFTDTRNAFEAYLIAKAEYAIEVVLSETYLSPEHMIQILKNQLGKLEADWNEYTDTVSPLVELQLLKKVKRELKLQ
ncbi:hypothetical protein ACNO7T_15720 [Vibrio campbellii]